MDNKNVATIPNEHVPALSKKNIYLLVQKVKNKSKKVKILTDPNEMATFCELCKENMPLDLLTLGIHFPAVMSSAPGPSTATDVPPGFNKTICKITFENTAVVKMCFLQAL